MKKYVVLAAIIAAYSAPAFAQGFDAEQIKKNAMKSIAATMHQGRSEADMKRSNALGAKYHVCENMYKSKTPNEYKEFMQGDKFAGSFEQKEKMLLDLAAKYPASPYIPSEYAMVLIRHRKFSEADSYLAKYLQQFPRDPKLLFTKDQNDFAKANANLDDAVLNTKLTDAVNDFTHAITECMVAQTQKAMQTKK